MKQESIIEKLEIPLWFLKIQSRVIKVKERENNFPGFAGLFFFVIVLIAIPIMAYMPKSWIQYLNTNFIGYSVGAYMIFVVWAIAVKAIHKKYISDMNPDILEKYSYHLGRIGIGFNKLEMDKNLSNTTQNDIQELSIVVDDIIAKLDDINNKKQKDTLIEFKHTLNKLRSITDINSDRRFIGNDLIHIGYIVHNQKEILCSIKYISDFNKKINELEIKEITLKDRMIDKPINKFKEYSEINQLLIISAIFVVTYLFFPPLQIILIAIYAAIFGIYFQKIFIDKK